ncbi:MAG: rhodanese-like domain-containing protein ['Candidatus Kapabacteria' thiocyanatum]|uniref:Rhodanese domain-containing protein n=1 Tax=Candidatus Kapaibacterium thiocyanatum TaxID=1895771 RepID=A0A1M3KXH3_9BACT|nr:rhodanese-like domain-containing protein ['Candidatus Kapabacteria' thiocyanatum]OJX57112.1 MAG: hypothetical protein BGO89_11450 ['Candidatus Kapabacteria' thiocyanatum]
MGKKHYVAVMIALLVVVAKAFAGDTGDVTVEQARKMIDRKNVIVLDVRKADEYAAGHLANAVWIDFYSDKFESRVKKLSRKKQIVVYCATGRRSAATLEMMKKNGFTNAHDMLGGYKAWAEKGQPVVIPKSSGGRKGK